MGTPLHLLTMASSSRTIFSQLARRRTLTSSNLRNYSAAAEDGAEHAGTGMKQWKLLSFIVALPGCGLCFLNAVLSHEHHEQAEFIPYEHLRLRTKRFPWGEGKKSLFHNAHTNALPDGYEEQ